MPSTIGGLLIAAALLLPGFVFHVRRRANTPLPRLSTLVETATFVAVSVVTNTFALGAFGVVRAITPRHTPDAGELIADGGGYVADRPGYVLTWVAAALGLSSLVAWAAAEQWGPIGWIAKRVAPVIVDVPAWYHVFEACPPDKHVYVGCDLADGAYIGGFLDWYSTEVEETADRDLVLAEPLTFRPADESEDRVLTFSRLVVSARQISRLYVSFLDAGPQVAGADSTP